MQDREVSKWDVALEAMAQEEFRRQGRPLRLEDFQRLAHIHAMRLDDIMATLFELVIQGEWTYRDEQGQPREFGRETLDALYVKGRLREEDLRVFGGGWQPRG